MTSFWNLLKESVIMQAILTLAVTGVYIYLVCAQLPVPVLVETLIGLV